MINLNRLKTFIAQDTQQYFYAQLIIGPVGIGFSEISILLYRSNIYIFL